CRSGDSYPIARVDDDGREWLETRLLPLCIVLETLRAELGGHPIHITSGYRTESYNRQIGGALRSQHVQGRAADIHIDEVAPAEVYKALMRLSEANKIYIGAAAFYPSWTHV